MTDPNATGAPNSPSNQTPPAPPPAPAAAATAATPPATATPPSAPSTFRDYLSQKMGQPIPAEIPDAELFDRATAAMQDSVRARQMLTDPVVQAALTRRAEVEKLVTGQQAPAAPKSVFDAKPEWNPDWGQFVKHDESSGYFVPAPGQPPEYAIKANQYVQWQRNVDRQLKEDPAGVLWPVFEEKVEKFLQDRLTKQASASRAQEIVKGHEEWMVQKDAQGKVLYGFDQKPLLTVAGTEYLQISSDLFNKGLQDLEHLDTITRKLMSNRPWEKGQQPTGAAAPAAGTDARNMAWALNQAGANRTAGLNPGSPVGAGQQPPDLKGLTFREKMMRSKDAILR